MGSSWPATFKPFYKLVLENQATIIYIPPDLGWAFRGMLHRNCTVRTPVGQSWTVHIENRNGKVCFTNGWGDFVNQNKIQFGFVLFFTPAADYSFDVVIFNRVAAETKDYGFNPSKALCGTSFRVTMNSTLVGRPRFVIPMNFWRTFIREPVNSALLIKGNKHWEIQISNDDSKHTMEGGCRGLIADCGLGSESVIEFKILKRHPLTFELVIHE